jgi:hypothetical protein
MPNEVHDVPVSLCRFLDKSHFTATEDLRAQFQASAKYVADIEFFEPSLRPVVSCPDPLLGRIEMPVEFRPCLKNVVRGTRENASPAPVILPLPRDDPAFSALDDSPGMAMAAACQLPGHNLVS